MRYCLRLLLLLFGFSAMAMAHQTGLSYLQLIQSDGGVINVIYKKPLEDSQADDIQINFPSNCYKVNPKIVTINNGYTIFRYVLRCSGGTLIGSRIWIDGLVSTDKGLLVEYRDKDLRQQNLLRSIQPYILIEKNPSRWKIFVEYVKLGFSHILLGFDHLLFLIAILFLSKNLRQLIYAITAFTLAHSVTLGLTIFGWINVPVPYVEAMIALSILILFREVIKDEKNSISRQYLPLMVFVFGLLHGLGFASVLSQIGLPQHDIVTSLVAFNIGIEMGQLLFVMTAGVILLTVDSVFSNKKVQIIKFLSFALGGISTFWLIERVMVF